MSSSDFESGAAQHGWVRTAKTVLLVVEDALVRELIADGLRRAGCYPLAVAGVAEGQRLVEQIVPDAIVLDLDSGHAAAARWASDVAASSPRKAVRTIMLSAHRDHQCGADGALCAAHLCLSKPVDPRAFVLGVLRLLRTPRSSVRPRAKTPIHRPNVEVERDDPQVRLRVQGQWHSVALSRTEHRTLIALLDEWPRLVRREALVQAAWGDQGVGLRTVDQSIKRLRAMLERVGARELVRTVAGSGYRIDMSVLDGGAEPAHAVPSSGQPRAR